MRDAARRVFRVHGLLLLRLSDAACPGAIGFTTEVRLFVLAALGGDGAGLCSVDASSGYPWQCRWPR